MRTRLRELSKFGVVGCAHSGSGLRLGCRTPKRSFFQRGIFCGKEGSPWCAKSGAVPSRSLRSGRITVGMSDQLCLHIGVSIFMVTNHEVGAKSLDRRRQVGVE